MDGNVLRVVSRLCVDRSDIADPGVKRAVRDKLQEIMPLGHAGAFNQALMELGATVCVPNGPPNCTVCPLEGLCEGYKQGIAAELPVKSAKKSRRIEKRTILLLIRDGMLAIKRRENRGLLAGLWELPSLGGHLDAAQTVKTVRAWGLEPLRVEPLGERKHIFSHVEWQMTGLRILVEEAFSVEGLIWASPGQLREKYPLPSAFSGYLAPFLEE